MGDHQGPHCTFRLNKREKDQAQKIIIQKEILF